PEALFLMASVRPPSWLSLRLPFAVIQASRVCVLESAMPMYVVLSNFTESGRTDVKNTSERLSRLGPVADKLGVKVVANAITMGQYDVVTIMEAPDDATIARVVGTVLSRGYVTTQTMRGFSIEEFAQITSNL